MRKAKAIVGLAVLRLLGADALAQSISIPGPLQPTDPHLSRTMTEIAIQVLKQFPAQTPDDRFRLELAAGQYTHAVATLAEIRTGRPSGNTDVLLNLRWEIYARARENELSNRLDFPTAFRRAAAEALQGLEGLTAYKVIYSLNTPIFVLDDRLDDALKAQIGRSTLDVQSAITLVRTWLNDDAYHAFHSELAAVGDADDSRRYLVQLDLPVRTPDGAVVCAYVVRPRTADRLPALLGFTIYADRTANLDDARITAAHGYAAVVGFTRGKACSPDAPIPIEHDGTDADALIDWIAAQPWSDGRVGMYGGSYNGFTQWAAAKHPPKALKALMPAVSFSPGTDFPMEGNIFLTEAFSWTLYTTTNSTLDEATYDDQARWERLKRAWYVSGRPYRDLDQIYGAPNPWFDRWLGHPSFDAYWRSFIPTDRELSTMNIPALTTTGYYDSGQIGALSYILRRERLNPKAEQYLVIGPYGHHTGQLGTITPLGSRQPTLRGYDLDPVAQLDIVALRYAWFDHIFKGAPKPAILADRVNYEVMGANVWKHAPSVTAINGKMRRFYLSDANPDGRHVLASVPGQRNAGTVQVVDLSYRGDVDSFAPAGPMIDQADDDWPIVSRAPNLPNAVVFVSNPFAQAPEISGLFSGEVDLVTNKKDLDIAVTLFELKADGRYVQLSYTWQRASFAKDRRRRQLLVPGKRTAINFRAGRLTSRQLQSGSRLVVVLNVIKQPGEEINYGTGKNVSYEDIGDAGAPLKITWFADSFIDIPMASGSPARIPRSCAITKKLRVESRL